MSPNDRYDLDDRHDAALDRLLAQARWEEPTAADEYRLREGWIRLRHRRRIGPAVTIAAAAAIVLVVGGIALLRPERVAVVQEVNAPVKLLVTQGREEQLEVVSSRPANMYERLLVMKGPTPHPVAPNAPPPSPMDATVNQLIQQLGDPLVERRFQAAHALATLPDPRVVTILTEMVDRGENYREALAALMWSADPSAAVALARLGQSSQTIHAQVLALKNEFGEGSQRRFPWSALDFWLHFSV